LHFEKRRSSDVETSSIKLVFEYQIQCEVEALSACRNTQVNKDRKINLRAPETNASPSSWQIKSKREGERKISTSNNFKTPPTPCERFVQQTRPSSRIVRDSIPCPYPCSFHFHSVFRSPFSLIEETGSTTAPASTQRRHRAKAMAGNLLLRSHAVDSLGRRRSVCLFLLLGLGAQVVRQVEALGQQCYH
jgi:hypothetical protein